jgi:PAS domain S-box-containing protein
VQRYNEVIHEGTLYDLECRVIRPDGSVRFLQSMGEPIRNPDGAVVKLVGALLDITERRQTEDNLGPAKKQTAYLDELFELAPEAIVLRDVHNRVVRINREFTRLFGYTSEEFVGRPFAELITPDELWNEAKGYGYLLDRGQRLEAETIRQRKDGTRLNVSFVAAPVSVSGGQIAVYAIYRDITERKRAEEALREAQAELAHVTRVMTMGELTASIAHEVNQPLAAVITNANACLRWLASGTPNLDEARRQ